MDPIQASGELVFDTTLGGKVFSIKLLNANEQLASEDPKFLAVVNILVNELNLPLTSQILAMSGLGTITCHLVPNAPK